MNLIVDIQYFPSLELYKISKDFSNIVFEQYENFQKMSFRNRCQIAGGEGVIDLSIPLEKGRDQKTLMKNVRIADGQPWQSRHWKTIVSCYNRSPWFEFYRDDLEALYKTRYAFLLDWNLACFEWTVKVLRLPVTVSLTDQFKKVYTREEGVDWRGKLVPGKRGKGLVVPASGAAGPGLPNGDEALLDFPAPGDPTANSPIFESQFPTHSEPLRYRQVFEERTGFIPGLSILDLLFCEGKEAIRYIR